MPTANDFTRHEHHAFMEASSQALANEPLQVALARLTDKLGEGNRRGFAALPGSDALRDHAKHVKQHTLAHLDRYLEQLETSVQKVGGQVHWASTADDGRDIVADIAKRAGCTHAVKSKSMTSEEIHLNPALEAAGIEVTETDFGEFIIQLTGERPSHLVAPALHHTRQSIAQVLSRHVGTQLPDDARVLALTGRKVLREKFRAADLGISGVNFAVAETGTIVLVTNEGNGRLTTTCPRVHIALMGMEKVIPRLADLPVFLKLLARAASGQALSVYTTLITGPRRPGELDGPEEFHLVILDNGRSRILGSPFRESLQCIRCGACLNACPVYRRVGGHAYGGVYSGPIGSILTPLFDSVSDNPELPHASSLCGACLAACPVRINIPHMLIGLRELQHHGKPNRWENLAYRLWAGLLRRPRLYGIVLRLAGVLSRTLTDERWLGWLPGAGRGWTEARDFPHAGASAVPAALERAESNEVARRRPRGPAPMSSPRDDFLERVRRALAEGTKQAASPAIEPRGSTGYQGAGADPVATFVTQLKAVGGTAHVVRDEDAAVRTVGELVKAMNARRILLGDAPLLNRLPIGQHLLSLGMEVTRVEDLKPDTAREVCFAADVGISGVDSLIAETGTLIVRSGAHEPRSLTLLPPVHIAVAERQQLLPDLFDLFDPSQEWSRPPPSCLTLIAGPSKTGDIELRLVTGVHGPGEVHVVLLDR